MTDMYDTLLHNTHIAGCNTCQLMESSSILCNDWGPAPKLISTVPPGDTSGEEEDVSDIGGRN